MIWSVYYGDREYARERGDPLLGTVEAEGKAEAFERAGECRFLTRGTAPIVAGAGLWVCPASEIGEKARVARMKVRDADD